MNPHWLMVVALAAALFSTALAWARHECLERSKMVGQLLAKYDEQPWGRGLVPRAGIVIELLVSPTGSWTILESRTDGISCFVSVGEEWIPRPDDNSQPDEDASHD